jgi:hypothetical protein
LLLKLEKEESYMISWLFYWGKAPKPPWIRFAEVLGLGTFCGAEQTLFASFSGKRRTLSILSID